MRKTYTHGWVRWMRHNGEWSLWHRRGEKPHQIACKRPYIPASRRQKSKVPPLDDTEQCIRCAYPELLPRPAKHFIPD